MRLHLNVQPDCDRCSLQGQTIVWGYGKPEGICVVGEAPGREEVREGRPLIGNSGSLLRKALSIIDIDPDDCYYTNVVQCRPPGNRDPSQVEIRSCRGRLMAEIDAVRPTRLLLLGSVATNAIFGKPVNSVRSRYLDFNGTPTISTYHPAFILRNPYAFQDFLNDLAKLHTHPQDELESKYQVATCEEEALSYLWHLKGYVSLDIETSKYSPYKDQFICVGLCNDGKNCYIIPAELMTSAVCQNIEKMSQRCSVICHNADFEYRWLKHKFDITLSVTDDTMLMHYVLDERAGGNSSEEGGYSTEIHSLKVLGGYYFDMPDWSSVMKPYSGNYALAPKDILYEYLGKDLVTTWHLQRLLSTCLNEQLHKVYRNLVMCYQPVLSQMSLQGFPVDWKYICGLEDVLDKDIDVAYKSLCEELGIEEINLRSSKQMQKLLFEDLKLPNIKDGSTGKKIMDRLERMTGSKYLIDIKNLRKRMHAKSAFVLGLQELIQKDGKIHTHFLQHGTGTGRLASRSPNMQNIPNHFGYGELIRGSFIPTEGWELLEADYKQLEFRVTAYYSQDPKLIEFINSGRDIHSEVAALYFDCRPEDVTSDQRHDAKRVVFGVAYVRGPQSLSDEYGIPLAEAKRRIDLFYQMFPGIKQYQIDAASRAIEVGYSESMFGRRRRFPLLTRDNIAEVKRQAINAPIQSTASDICLTSLMRIVEKSDPELVRPILTIHDAILFEVRKGHVEEQAQWITQEMQQDPFPTPVKFLVDCKRGERWGQMRKL